MIIILFATQSVLLVRYFSICWASVLYWFNTSHEVYVAKASVKFCCIFFMLLIFSLQVSIQGCFLPQRAQGNQICMILHSMPILSSQVAIYFRQRLGSCSWLINRGYSLHPLKLLAQWIPEVKSPLFFMTFQSQAGKPYIYSDRMPSLKNL